MNTPHILVVDDEKEITDLIEIYLTQEGYQVEKRYNAFTLMNDILEYHIDLVILDIMMPEIDGIHALFVKNIMCLLLLFQPKLLILIKLKDY